MTPDTVEEQRDHIAELMEECNRLAEMIVYAEGTMKQRVAAAERWDILRCSRYFDQ